MNDETPRRQTSTFEVQPRCSEAAIPSNRRWLFTSQICRSNDSYQTSRPRRWASRCSGCSRQHRIASSDSQYDTVIPTPSSPRAPIIPRNPGCCRASSSMRIANRRYPAASAVERFEEKMTAKLVAGICGGVAEAFNGSPGQTVVPPGNRLKSEKAVPAANPVNANLPQVSPFGHLKKHNSRLSLKKLDDPKCH